MVADDRFMVASDHSLNDLCATNVVLRECTLDHARSESSLGTPMLPAVQDYLDKLPTGVASYPGAQVKGAVVRNLVFGCDAATRIRPGDMPDEADSMLRDLPSAGEWVGTVHFVALLAGIYDACFKEKGRMEAFENWTLAHNRKLLSGPLYRVLFVVASPERVFVGAERRWETFYKQSNLRVGAVGPKAATLTLTYAPHIFPEYVLRGHGTGLRAAGEAAGLQKLRVDLSSETAGKTLYSLAWA
jgi:hypothetical protein